MSPSDIRIILSEIPDGCVFICGDAVVCPLFGFPKPPLHKALIKAALQDLLLASH